MDHSNIVSLVAATVAHEMGHNFGMEHDGPDCECPEEKYVVVSHSDINFRYSPLGHISLPSATIEAQRFHMIAFKIAGA